MPKRKRGITGDVASRREAIRKRERRVVETEEERSRRLSTMAQRGQDRRARETEEQRNSRLSDMAQRGQERRAEETDEQRNSRLAVMGQRSQQRRAEETEEQTNSRLAVMAQRGQKRRAEERDENHHQIQTFYAARTVLYPIVEEHNCGEMENLCLKCGGLYFRDEKNTRGIYTHCCHNGNIIEQASVCPVEMKGLMDGSDELSVHFKNNIRSYQCFNGCTDCTVYRERSVLLQNSWPNLS
ncbi:hypothetical protein AVEN_44219-1 [Araneus ventricosus]|uniref:STPR domain-containing protein n=1 Tax=Araneus ventricosus TaxID=182803 RepID=A0A4Y2S334_ARAVE|nr:hypothetical protein AVEN_44219-1 [Araneus ventricosus]